MENKKKILIIGGVSLLVVALIGGLLFKLLFVGSSDNKEVTNQEVAMGEPLDIVLDFYAEWLEAAQSTSTNPYQLELGTRPILSEALRNRLKDAAGQEVKTPDPVLCQTNVPEKITGRVVFAVEGKTQILVMSRDKAVFEQAIVSLTKLNDGWYIDDITCSPGEFAPEREFTFEQEGYLLKKVPPPLDPQYWHVIFEENGELGHFAPLFFDAESKCLSLDREETVCAPDQFTETAKVRIFGQMIESGVEVTRLELVPTDD